MKNLDLTRVRVMPSLPHWRDLNPEEMFPEDLVGSIIVCIGTAEDEGIEGGGLIIDYRPSGKSENRRLVLGFNEIGMWVEYLCTLPEPSNQV